MLRTVHIARKGKVIGKYPEADMHVLVAAGTVLRTDHYWKVGMPRWLVVGRTFDFVAPEPEPEAPRRPRGPQDLGPRFTCLRCEARFDDPEEEKPGNVVMEILCWLCGPVAGGLYSGSRILGKTQHCPKCGSQHLEEQVW